MNPKGKEGIAFVIVLGLILILVIAAASFILISSSELKMVSRQDDSTKAFYIAEAGLAHARHDLGQDSTWTDNVINGVACFLTNVDSDGFYLLNYSSATRTALGGEFTVRLKNISGVSDEIRIKSIGTYKDATRTIRAEISATGGLGSVSVDYAIEMEGELSITSAAVTITPDPDEGGVNEGATLSFEDVFGATKEELEAYQKLGKQELMIEALYYKNGAKYLSGSATDVWGSMPGISLHQELEVLHRIGLSNREVLATSTTNFNEAYGLKFGRIKKGFKANILILDKNPVEDLIHLKEI